MSTCSKSALRVNQVRYKFDRDRLPLARDFYLRELGELRRPNRKGWAQPKSGCPFHPSRSKTSFGVNLDSGAFFCFGCSAKGGDIVDYIRLRDRCDFPTACKLLDCWRDVDENECRQLEERAAKLQHEKELAEQAKREQRAKIIALRDEIHTTAAIYQEISYRLSELQRGMPEAYEGEQEHCWACIALAVDDLRMCEGEYSCAAGLESPYAD